MPRNVWCTRNFEHVVKEKVNRHSMSNLKRMPVKQFKAPLAVLVILHMFFLFIRVVGGI